MPELSLTRRYSIPALHTLTGENFSSEENARVFGPCSRLHGHEYLVDVTVSGTVDQVTGMLVSRDELDRVVREQLVAPLSGTNLSLSFPFTTGEALAGEFFRILETALPPGLHLAALTVHETAKNRFVARAGNPG